MNYTEILAKLKSLHENIKNAEAIGESQRVKRYKYQINDLEQKKKKAEIDDTLGVVRDQEKMIKKLEDNLGASLESQKILTEQIEGLQEKFEKLIESLNPIKVVIEEKPTKTSCPKCEKWFTEDTMTEHQKGCKASKQW